MAVLTEYTYVFVIGTFFAMLDAYNNGANDVANSWATSVSSRSITYRWAMILAFIFETTGAITVGARTASTIKGGIIPLEAFDNNAGVQMLAFTCALAGASTWVMWFAGVGVAVAGASNVQWGWNNGQGMGAIFAGLVMAPIISGGFGALIFLMIKYIVHVRKDPVPWAIYSSPFFFLIAGTVCALSIVYKGSPNLKLNDRPTSFIVGVSLGTGGLLCLLSAVFFVPFVHAKVVKRDHTIRYWHVLLGPMLFRRPAPADSTQAAVPNYAVVQKDDESADSSRGSMLERDHSGDATNPTNEKSIAVAEGGGQRQLTYHEKVAQGRELHHAKLRKGKGPLGWAMRVLHNNRMGDGSLYEIHNLKAAVKRLPAMVVVAALYGLNYDIHTAQAGISGTPEGDRMEKVYSHAPQYPNEVEHSYSFVQVLTACTASFAHGANDIGNAVGPWAVIYSAWSTGDAAQSKAPVPIWQLAVLAIVLSLGLITYGYNIMKVMGNKLTYHSPSRGCSMELGAAITVLIFSQYSLPVSTSMCITGATVGVGLCNGTYKAVNWQRIGLLMTGWIATIPIAGTIGGITMAIVLNAPHFGS